MDRLRFSAIAHATHDLMSPVSLAVVDRFLRPLDGGAAALVLDLGCGRGELLIRMMEQTGCIGIGVDVSPAMIEAAAARAAARGVEPTWVVSDMTAFEETGFDVVLCVGAMPGGGFGRALAQVGRHARPGGQLLIGDGYWKKPPADAYLERLGAARDDYASYDDTLRAATEAGFVVRDAHASTLEEWDAYEDRYARSIDAHCEAHPDDPDVAPMRARIAAWRETYERWGRDTLGFALLRCERPTSASPSDQACAVLGCVGEAAAKLAPVR